MFENRNDQEFMDLVLSAPGTTDAELALVERLQAAIDEIERLTALVRERVPVTLPQAPTGQEEPCVQDA